MKRKLQILLLLSLTCSVSSFGRKTGGVYMNAADYKNNKLSYSDFEHGKSRIYIHDFFWSMPTVKVLSEGKKYTYRKSELYGFRDRNNYVYRFYNNTEYRIVEAGNIYIYAQQENIAQSKGYKVVNVYYFSTTADGSILRLTVNNLKSVYHDNDKFCDLLDQYFGADDVNTYDTKHHTFKVNYVYSKTMK